MRPYSIVPRRVRVRRASFTNFKFQVRLRKEMHDWWLWHRPFARRPGRKVSA